MCGRYTQTAAFDELAQGFGTILENAGREDLTARSNQFPSQNVPIIVVSKGVQQLVLVILHGDLSGSMRPDAPDHHAGLPRD